MTGGILATIAVRDPRHCSVTPLSDDGLVRSVSRGRASDGSIPVEATVEDDGETAHDDVDEVFRYDEATVYRLDHPADVNCACEKIGDQGCSVRDVTARDRVLELTFIVDDLADIRDVVADLRAASDGVTVRSLRRSGDGESQSEPVFVDRQSFTPRQREVLRTAHELGYFERPKGSNATEVACELDVSRATFAEHLAAAQTKLMDALFADVAGEA